MASFVWWFSWNAEKNAAIHDQSWSEGPDLYDRIPCHSPPPPHRPSSIHLKIVCNLIHSIAIGDRFTTITSYFRPESREWYSH